jgi:hypothetical protein
MIVVVPLGRTLPAGRARDVQSNASSDAAYPLLVVRLKFGGRLGERELIDERLPVGE